MANRNGNAYGLTTFCPIKQGTAEDEGCPPGESYAACIRHRLQNLGLDENSPMARVRNTYFSRFFVLDNVFYEGKPAKFDELKSKYLVFTASFHGELEPYLESLWNSAGDDLKHVWKHCVGFDGVNSAAKFTEYIKKCQVPTTFFFNGSTDDSLAEQLKSLYLKQEFSRFAFENQGKSSADLQQAFREFVERVRPDDLCAPTWRPGQATL